MRLAARLLAFALILGVLAGLCLHYGATASAHDPYPETGDLATDYDAHVGEEALVFGEVAAVDDGANSASIRVDSADGPFELTVRDFTTAIESGGLVQVHGTLRPDRTIEPDTVEVVNPSGSSDLYKYAVSAVGAVLVLVVFLRRWRLNTDSHAFEVRSDG